MSLHVTVQHGYQWFVIVLYDVLRVNFIIPSTALSIGKRAHRVEQTTWLMMIISDTLP
jgi:hypothetical protein